MSKRAEFFDGKCCIKGCENTELAVGLCNKHWRRMKKYGSPVLLEMPAAAFIGMPVEQRFLRFVVKKETGCWEWAGGKDSDGYGSFRGEVGGVLYRRAHRFSIAHYKGIHPKDGENVCHTCDNPSCCNPDHLFVGTVADNQKDKWRKNRGKVHYGNSHWSTSLSDDDVRAIRGSNEKQAVLAQKYSISQATVSDIRRRKSWRHVE